MAVERVVGDEVVELAIVAAVVAHAERVVSDGSGREASGCACVEESAEVAREIEPDIGDQPDDGEGQSRQRDQESGPRRGLG